MGYLCFVLLSISTIPSNEQSKSGKNVSSISPCSQFPTNASNLLVKISSTKLNHANLIIIEKRSFIESETDFCLTRATLFVLIVMSQKRKIW